MDAFFFVANDDGILSIFCVTTENLLYALLIFFTLMYPKYYNTFWLHVVNSYLVMLRFTENAKYIENDVTFIFFAAMASFLSFATPPQFIFI